MSGERSHAALILAAGASTRLGQPKQLVRIGGKSLLRRTARLAIEAGCAPVIAVLGYESAQMQPELDGLNVTPAVNESWAEGMGSSLRCGMAAIARLHPAPSSLLLLVCDQIRLSAEHLQRLLRQPLAAETLIVASEYAGRSGVPAVFAASLFPELAAVTGDRGARDLIRAHSRQTRTIPWPEGTVELDRPEDFQQISGSARNPDRTR